MNLYFLVEGKRTEKKVYPAWLRHLLPELQRVDTYDLVNVKNYYLISGEGYPSLLNHISNSIEEINLSGKYNYFVVCLDAEENTVPDIRNEIDEFIRKESFELGKTKLVIIVQNRCLETWFLGNRKIYSRNPQNQPLLNYSRYYDVSADDPELMGKYNEFNTHAQFHDAYLTALFEAKNLTYNKRRPSEVLKSYYLNELKARIEAQPQQLNTFKSFIDFCNTVKAEFQK
jgi:myosin-crossreactive antigen